MTKIEPAEAKRPRLTKAKTWGDVYFYYLDQGHDSGSAAYNADNWERGVRVRTKAKEGQKP